MSLFLGGAPAQPRAVAEIVADEAPPAQAPDTPRATRRSSRSRTRSPEPVVSAPIAQDPTLSAVTEEPEEQKDTENEYERIIDDTEADTENQQQQQDYDEDALLEEESEQQPPPQQQPATQQQQQQQPSADEQMDTSEVGEKPAGAEQTTEDENRGVKRRSDSPSKGNSPKKRQRLPPPNVDDFVNDEDEPELDESKIQLSWCEYINLTDFPHFKLF
jgi:heterogeneous nuclear ribonucleoprotein U-like protein 1